MAGQRVSGRPILRGAGPATWLTARQVEVLRLAARGLSEKQIARHLGISVRTVEKHFHAMRDRIGTRSQGELIACAVAAGLVTVDVSRPGRLGGGARRVAGERLERSDGTVQHTAPDVSVSACDETPPAIADSRDETPHRAVVSPRCQVCGEPVSVASTGRPRRYCSTAGDLLRDETPELGTGRLCQVCGGPVPAAATGRPRSYCSRSCQARAYRARKNAGA
jgi:DNA-binding CsgD family transcriptional regulator